MKFKHTISLLVLGVLSGFVTVFVLRNTASLNPVEWSGATPQIAGWVFGVIVGAYYVANHYIRSMVWKYPLFALGSGLAHHVAYFSALTGIPYFADEINISFGPYVGFFLAGVVGSLILLVVWVLLFEKVRHEYFAAIVLVGGLLGVFGFFNGSFELELLYLVWQGGVAASLGYALDRRAAIV